MNSRKLLEGLGPVKNGKQKPITPYAGSWADQESRRPRKPISPEQERQRRAGVVHPEIANAVSLGQTDDMGLPVGKGGMRRFPTSAPDAESTSGVLLGQAGYQQWARDMHERGEKVPTWGEGTPYQTESVAAKIVDALIEGRDQFPPGTRVQVSGGSGIDSDKVGTVIDRSSVKTRSTGGGIIPDIQGHYKPADWSREVAVKLDDGGVITMFKNRLTALPSGNPGGR